RAGWEDHDGELPIVEGTLIRLHVDHLPGDRSPEPLWLWSSRARTSAEVDRAWQAFLRRFDIEHTFIPRGSARLLHDVALARHVPGSATDLRGCGARGW
ncbi:MAG TPA: hypothetical protein VEH05_03585, partial [Streptosporangiaceae bacterium]|nr:hypothetical protein [Streptosporangiaceae bacterium]